jgi:Tfp pilus assembly protein PilN
MTTLNALGLNFVKRRRYVSPLGLFLSVVGVVAVALVVLDYSDARDELARVQQQQARQQRPVATPRPRVSAKPLPKEDANVVGRVATQLNLPWNTVLNDIDSLVDPAVAVLSVEAQGPARSLRLIGEAREMTEVVAYLRRLRKLPSITSANLSHHEERTAAGITVLRFSLDATWRATP